MSAWPLKLADLLAKWKSSHQKLISPALLLWSPSSGKNLFLSSRYRILFLVLFVCFLSLSAIPTLILHIFLGFSALTFLTSPFCFLLLLCLTYYFSSHHHLSSSTTSTYPALFSLSFLLFPFSYFSLLCVEALPKWWLSALLRATEQGSQSNSFLKFTLYCCLFLKSVDSFSPLLKGSLRSVWNKVLFFIVQ